MRIFSDDIRNDETDFGEKADRARKWTCEGFVESKRFARGGGDAELSVLILTMTLLIFKKKVGREKR